MRTAAALVAGAFVASLGALILGEYELRGALPYVAGALFGLAVAETIITVARPPRPVLAAVGAAFAAGGFVWAAWIEAGRDWGYVEASAWVGAVVAAVAAAGWIRSFGTRGPRSPQSPAHTPDG